jgi:CheY-like chemotaxis protein
MEQGTGREQAGVLVVEDDGAIRMLLEEVLAGEGYRVRAAADGAAGLAVLREWRPDAVLLDLVMPGIGAPEFRAAQLGMPRIADVPVLLLSATRAADLQTIAGDLGAAAWLPKPFDVDALLAAVARLVAGQGAAPAPTHPVVHPARLGEFPTPEVSHGSPSVLPAPAGAVRPPQQPAG